MVGNGQVVQIEIAVVDAAGNRVKMADNEVTCTVTGPARLLGLENSDMRDTTPAAASTKRAAGGRLLAYVERTEGNGPIRITATAPGLKATEILVE